VLVTSMLVLLPLSLNAQEEPGETPTSDTDELVQGLTAFDPRERAEAARALGEAGDPAAVPALIRTLTTDALGEIRGWAARALQQIGTPEARSAVARAGWTDPDRRVRTLAQSLSGVTAPPPGYVSRRREESRRGARDSSRPPECPRRERDSNRSIYTTGWLVFGIAYAATFITGIALCASEYCDEGQYLLIPIAGPTVEGVIFFDDGYITAGVVSVLESLVQVGGLLMGIIGSVRAERARRERRRNRRSHNITFVASGPGGGPGFSLAGQF